MTSEDLNKHMDGIKIKLEKIKEILSSEGIQFTEKEMNCVINNNQNLSRKLSILLFDPRDLFFVQYIMAIKKLNQNYTVYYDSKDERHRDYIEHIFLEYIDGVLISKFAITAH